MSSFPAALFTVALLAAFPVAAADAPPTLPSCGAGVRHIELEAEATGEPPEVCIRPGLTTTVLLDSKRVRVELPGRERFLQVVETGNMLVLLPSESLHDGERIPVTFHFEDGAAPTSARVLLVVHPAQAARQVEVSRHPRPVASYRQEARQAREEARQCQEEKAHLQVECRGRAGLTGLIAHRLVWHEGVTSRDLRKQVTVPPDSPLTPAEALCYRSTTRRMEGVERIVRLAVQLDLINRSATPWMTEGAALLGSKGEAPQVLEVWQPEPIPPGEWRTVVVEVELTEREARGPFILKLWAGEGDARSVTFHGITFP